MATFDGPNKLIILDNGTTSITVQSVYSDWKKWMLLSDNAKYLPAFSVIGGEPTVSGQYLGSTYFINNGWKIRPYEGNHTLVVSGNLLSSDGSSPFVSTIGNFRVLINLNTSNIIDKVATSGSTGPTADEIATAVWNKMLASHQIDGSAGKALSTASTGGVDVDVLAAAIWDEPYEDHQIPGTFGANIKTLVDVQMGNWEIAGTQMIFYKQDGTELVRYNLTNSTGNPSNSEVFKRTKV